MLRVGLLFRQIVECHRVSSIQKNTSGPVSNIRGCRITLRTQVSEAWLNPLFTLDGAMITNAYVLCQTWNNMMESRKNGTP